MPKINESTLAVLDGLTVTANSVKITQKLDRPLYEAVNKVLVAAGGKWNRKAQAHLFDESPAEVLDQIVLTGEYRNEKQELGVFYTPAKIAKLAVEACGDIRGKLVLEPEAGMGALAKAAHARGGMVRCIDVLQKHVDVLHAQGFNATLGDFLLEEPTDWVRFDVVLMNPPFAKQEDARHVLHAVKFVRAGGRIVAIMSAGVTFRETPFYREVRALASSIEPLPPGAFKESGTSVNAVLVTINL